MKKYELSLNCSWQEIRDCDVIFVLNRKKGLFSYFTDSGYFIFRLISEGKEYSEIINTCQQKYDVDYSFLVKSVDSFINQLLEEEIIHEYR